ncbi:MAG: MFS transporter, partial [Microbacterium sp.]|nr:MFS transporter [Microbacterium sp.]
MTSLRTPRGFNAWVAATVGSELGSGILAFALTWTASGLGPHVASAVLTLTVAPSVALALLGGAVADRFGPR